MIDADFGKGEAREVQGLKVGEEKVLRCDTCQRDLVLITSVLDSPQSMSFQAFCSNCQQKTFKKTLAGKLIIAPAPGIALEYKEVDMNKRYTLIEATIL